MDTTPETPATRATKVRVSKKAVPKSGSKAAPVAKQRPPAGERKRKALTVKPATPAVTDATELVAVAAYYLAERRRFVPGHELDDWLAAEQQLLSN